MSWHITADISSNLLFSSSFMFPVTRAGSIAAKVTRQWQLYCFQTTNPFWLNRRRWNTTFWHWHIHVLHNCDSHKLYYSTNVPYVFSEGRRDVVQSLCVTKGGRHDMSFFCLHNRTVHAVWGVKTLKAYHACKQYIVINMPQYKFYSSYVRMVTSWQIWNFMVFTLSTTQ